MATIGLVSCVSAKRERPMEARELYCSPLFEKARDYAEGRCDSWFILSAKYGLVAPDRVIEPYNETLKDKKVDQRRAWADVVWRDLRPALSPGDRVVILAGEKYREFLVERIARHGCVLDVPMEGMSIGRQLQWLSRQR
jgi:cytoplasmic iron level regulating protein YaaA (DUF328/UPF0246 family)